MKPYFYLVLMLACPFISFGQTDPLTQTHGAENQALGNIKVHNPHVWSIFNNVGALARISEPAIAVSYDQRYGLRDLSTLDFAAVIPGTKGSWGLGISRFGGKLFNQQSFGLGYSNQLGIVSMGLKAEWYQTQIEGFGSAGSMIFSFGGIAELSPDLFLGAHISNINRAKISAASSERLPTAIQMGAHYQVEESLNLYLEIEKDISEKPVSKLGLSYSIQDWVILRTGINTQPSRLFFGLGILPGRFAIHYAYGQNSALGASHHLSLEMKWKED